MHSKGLNRCTKCNLKTKKAQKDTKVAFIPTLFSSKSTPSRQFCVFLDYPCATHPYLAPKPATRINSINKSYVLYLLQASFCPVPLQTSVPQFLCTHSRYGPTEKAVS